MNNLSISKKTGVLLVVVGLLILAALVLFVLQNKFKSSDKQVKVTTTQLAEAKIPQGLPANLPIEKGAKVLQNYESATDDGRLQSTRQITSKKSASEALNTYVSFFQSLGWKGGINPSASTDAQKVAQFQNETGSLLIVARTVDKQSTVEFTLTQNKKQ